MSARKLAVLGVGNLVCGPAVLASLATYFGERPLEVRLYDADEERLDLMDRLARLLFAVGEAQHLTSSTSNIDEALNEADDVILCVDENCACKFVISTEERGQIPSGSPVALEQAFAEAEADVILTEPTDPQEALLSCLNALGDSLPVEAEVVSLVGPVGGVWSDAKSISDWPVAPENDAAIPFQILRWIRGDDRVQPLIDEYQKSPIRSWLDR